jgi:hypothetical protein
LIEQQHGNLTAGLEKEYKSLPITKVYGERSIEVAALLTVSGGFLDVFTYIGHGGVFANNDDRQCNILGISAVTANCSIQCICNAHYCIPAGHIDSLSHAITNCIKTLSETCTNLPP